MHCKLVMNQMYRVVVLYFAMYNEHCFKENNIYHILLNAPTITFPLPLKEALTDMSML